MLFVAVEVGHCERQGCQRGEGTSRFGVNQRDRKVMLAYCHLHTGDLLLWILCASLDRLKISCAGRVCVSQTQCQQSVRQNKVLQTSPSKGRGLFDCLQ
ncbi:hypothetical protein D3C73_1325280 [compost metagenome]